MKVDTSSMPKEEGVHNLAVTREQEDATAEGDEEDEDDKPAVNNPEERAENQK